MEFDLHIYIYIYYTSNLIPSLVLLPSPRGGKKRRRWRLNCGIPAHVHASITRILSAPLWHHRSNHPARFSPFCKGGLRFFRTPPFPLPITVISQDQDFCGGRFCETGIDEGQVSWMIFAEEDATIYTRCTFLFHRSQLKVKRTRMKFIRKLKISELKNPNTLKSKNFIRNFVRIPRSNDIPRFSPRSLTYPLFLLSLSYTLLEIKKNESTFTTKRKKKKKKKKQKARNQTIRKPAPRTNFQISKFPITQKPPIPFPKKEEKEICTS